MANEKVVLISGKSATGKSASLANLLDQPGVVYVNCEANKPLPFPNAFKQITVTDPTILFQVFEQAQAKDDIHTIVIDSLTFLMDLYEAKHVLTSADTRKAWQDYASFFRKLMQQHVAASNKTIIFLAHTSDVLNESEMVNETFVKLKGSLMNTGVEAWFTTVLSSKKLPIKKLENFANDYLNITDEERELGFKYVFQTRLTKDSVNERIRSPMKMWTPQETFIDNDLQKVLQKLALYYGT